jgi:hypothetical protein
MRKNAGPAQVRICLVIACHPGSNIRIHRGGSLANPRTKRTPANIPFWCDFGF